MFSSSGSFTQAQCKLAEQANKAVFLLYWRINRFRNMKISEILGLFDKIVLPILLYGCEVWGFHRAPEIERVHLKFCKRLLHVKQSTQNDFVYGELGRYPLHINGHERIVKYWLKIVCGEKSLFVNTLYQDLIVRIDQNTKYDWAREVRSLLFQCGFGEVWYNQGVGNAEVFCRLFKTRLHDRFKQDWGGRIRDSTRAIFYRSFKNSIWWIPRPYQGYLSSNRAHTPSYQQSQARCGDRSMAAPCHHKRKSSLSSL